MKTLGRMAESAPRSPAQLPAAQLLGASPPLPALDLIFVFFYFFIQYDNLCLLIR